jgi:hypothetical protein
VLRDSITHAGDPEFRAHGETFQCAIIHAHADDQAVTAKFTDGSHATRVGGGFLDCGGVWKLIGEFF